MDGIDSTDDKRALLFNNAAVGTVIFLAIAQVSLIGIYQPYTRSWIAIGLYFALASFASWRALYSQPNAPPEATATTAGIAGKDAVRSSPVAASPTAAEGNASDLVQAADASSRSQLLYESISSLLHTNCTTVLIVDVTFWLVLAPMMLATPDPVKAARFHRIFFSFSSYNQHIVNFFLVYVELFLCNIPFAFAKISVVGAYSVSYSLWAILVFLVSGHWLYPFLDTSLKTAPLAYFLLFASHWVFYGMFALAATKLRGVKGAARRPKIE